MPIKVEKYRPIVESKTSLPVAYDQSTWSDASFQESLKTSVLTLCDSYKNKDDVADKIRTSSTVQIEDVFKALDFVTSYQTYLPKPKLRVPMGERNFETYAADGHVSIEDIAFLTHGPTFRKEAFQGVYDILLTAGIDLYEVAKKESSNLPEVSMDFYRATSIKFGDKAWLIKLN